MLSVSHRTVEEADYDAYSASEYPDATKEAKDARASDIRERAARLSTYPYSVVLQVAYAELDYANRWLWKQLGPANGDCHQAQSYYPICTLQEPHSHRGKWLSHWLGKT